jgi:serine/threonine-protein kinase
MTAAPLSPDPQPEASASESVSPEEQALLHWLLEIHEQEGTASIPEELACQYPRLPQLLACMQALQAFSPVEAIPPAGMPGNAASGSEAFPRAFGPYDLLGELGRGGMGVVYHGQHRVLQSRVAIKVIRTSEFASSEEVRRFRQEGRAASRLRHTNIVQVHDAGEMDGTPFLVMQFVDGETLAQRLRRGPVDRETAVTLMIAVASAVDYLHQESILHRDLKPANILLDAQSVPFVSDFGLAKLFDVDQERTASGMLLGTPAYMSPEQAWGKPEQVGPATDVYSLGAILYELLTGVPPFQEKTPLDQLLRLRDAEPRPPRALNRQIPVELEQICLRCLEKQPQDRYRSAAELAEDLQRYRHGEPITLRPRDWWNALRRWVRREAPLVSHLAGFAVMALIEQLADLTSAGHRPPYLPVMGLLLLWTVLSIIMQKLLLRGFDSVKLVWIVTDGILFTTAVACAEGPVESLIVGYSLLIVASAMWYEEFPVLLMTLVSFLAYLVLLPIRGAPQPVHYPLIVGGILMVIGGVVMALVRRIRQLLKSQTGG